MISDERLEQISQCSDVATLFAYEQRQMARELLALRNQPVNQPYKLPDGFVAVPRKLTAENGAKFALSAEFYVDHTVTCHECAGEGCDDCGDKGQWEEAIMIGWPTIKEIWRRGINHFSPPTDSTT
ncbi:hypothetical protein PUG46_19330 [Erwiniaceae bacterium L1_55_4]|nr:hypothetical protein [Erwiniaceae bacterium L1_55_4]